MMRIAWLHGGLVAISHHDSPKIEVKAGLRGPTVLQLDMHVSGPLFPAASSLGIGLVGGSFLIDEEQLAGLVPAEFRAAHPSRHFYAQEIGEKWRGVAHAAWKRDSMELTDLAAQIASGIRASEEALSHVASAYSAQLAAVTRNGRFTDGTQFEDRCTRAVYGSIHVAFWEIAVLRDVVARFASRFAYRQPRQVKFSSLIRVAAAATMEAELSDYIARAAKRPDGWAAQFTAYRNLFTHTAPLQHIAGISLAVQQLLSTSSGESAPAVYFPLPADPHSIEESEAEGTRFRSRDDLIARIKVRPSRPSNPDALEFVAAALESLVNFAERVLPYSPLAPENVEITSADVIGSIRVSTKLSNP